MEFPLSFSVSLTVVLCCFEPDRLFHSLSLSYSWWHQSYLPLVINVPKYPSWTCQAVGRATLLRKRISLSLALFLAVDIQRRPQKVSLSQTGEDSSFRLADKKESKTPSISILWCFCFWLCFYFNFIYFFSVSPDVACGQNEQHSRSPAFFLTFLSYLECLFFIMLPNN